MIYQSILLSIGADFDSDNIKPLTPFEFIDWVLIPDISMVMIMEDMGVAEDDAIDVMKRSQSYGEVKFPEDDHSEVLNAIRGEVARAVKRRANL
jgi:hypothetical protein